jgi:hypothetical protein
VELPEMKWFILDHVVQVFLKCDDDDDDNDDEK